jgi:DNA-binding NtrC family response regulator
MKSTVTILENDQRQSKAICKLLQSHGWIAKAFDRYKDLAMDVKDSDSRITIINLDNIYIDAAMIRKLKLNSHLFLLQIIALSSQSFHPDLKEAFREHISVCLANPVDSDELLYWLTTFEP